MKKVRLYEDGELVEVIECATVEECDQKIASALRFDYEVEVEDEDGKVWCPV